MPAFCRLFVLGFACLLSFAVGPAMAQTQINTPPASAATVPEAAAPAIADPAPPPAAKDSSLQVPQPPQDALYTISDIKVDVTADSAAHARDQAFVMAEKKAFIELARRLSGLEDQQWKVTDTDLSGIVQDVELISERTSSVRYIGDFTIRFQPEAARAFFAEQHIAIIDRQGPVILLLPLYGDKAHAVLWESVTPWRAAWDKVDLMHDLVPLTLSLDPAGDAKILSTKEAAAGNDTAITKIAARYKVPAVAIAWLDAIAAGAAKIEVTVLLWRDEDDSGLLQPKTLTSSVLLPAPAAGPDDPAAMEIARDEVRKLLASALREDNGGAEASAPAAQPAVAPVVIGGEAGQPAAAVSPAQDMVAWLGVAAPISSMAEWLAIRRRLDGVPAIEKIDVDALDRTHASLTLHFKGDLPHLIQLLAQHGLALEQPGGQGMWVLHQTSVAPGPTGYNDALPRSMTLALPAPDRLAANRGN